MDKSRRAHSVLFGFDFQVNAAIVLMLENVSDMSALRLESNHEDIDLELTNSPYLSLAHLIDTPESIYRRAHISACYNTTVCFHYSLFSWGKSYI